MLRLAFLPERFAKAAQERSVKRTRRAGSRWETHRLNRIVDAKVIGLIRLLAQAVRAVADHDGGNPQPFNAFEMPKIHTRAHLNFSSSVILSTSSFTFIGFIMLLSNKIHCLADIYLRRAIWDYYT